VPRAGLSTAVVVAGAAEAADEVGLEKLTLAMVAKRFGVALPSLYKHVSGLDALLQKVSALVTAELAEELTAAAAGRAGADALRAMASAQRAYAKRHPGRYPAAQRVPDPADPAHVAAGEKAVGVSYAVLRGYGLDGDDLIDATRAVRSAVHGFVALEIAGGFGLPQDVDRSFDRLIEMVDLGLRNRVAAPAAELRS
jgi:AcrR family transcriptional regulator